MSVPVRPAEPALPRRVLWAAVAFLLLGFALLSLRMAATTSPTFDEPDQLAVGYASLTQGRHPYSVVNLRLSQVWSALPLLALDPPLGFPDAAQQQAGSVYNIGYGRLFVFANNHPPETIVFAGRCMVVLLGVALGWVLFAWSRRLHGDLAGLLTLTLYTGFPLVIAHSAVATTDIASTLFFTLAMLAIWHLLHRISPGNLAWAALATGALAATKISGLLIVPLAIALLVVRLRSDRPVEIALPGLRRTLTSPSFRTAHWYPLVAALFVSALGAWMVVWIVYGGPSATSQPGQGPFQVHPRYAGHPLIHGIDQLRIWQVLPRAYLFDLHQFVEAGSSRRSFLLGNYSLTGWWYFFPVAWLVKTPLSVFLALAVATCAAWQLRRRPRPQGVDWHGLSPLLVLALGYGAFALSGNLNIGARHLLPLFPFLLVFAGLAGRVVLRERRLRLTLTAVLFAGPLLEAALAHPQYLGYFNVFAGGPDRGYRVLSDSSADWGESLPQVKHWLEERKGRPGEKPPVYFSYFGNLDLAHYGIDDQTAVLLPQFYDTRLVKPYPFLPGTYVISTTMLNGIYGTPCMGPWRPAYETLYRETLQDMARFHAAMKDRAGLEALLARDGRSYWAGKLSRFDQLRFCRLCAWLRRREPDERITSAVHVYELSAGDLEAALDGPPVELAPPDAIKGADRFRDDELDFVK